MLSQLTERQKATGLKLSSLLISPALRAIREGAQRVTFSSISTEDGYRGEEVQLALGYLVFFIWMMKAINEDEDPRHLMEAGASLREHALWLLSRISELPEVVSELKEVYPGFDAQKELALGRIKSTDAQWMKSLSRGVVVSARMMGYSYCNYYGVQPLAPVSIDFGYAFSTIASDLSTMRSKNGLMQFWPD